MKEKQSYDLYIFKKTTFTGIVFGFAVFLFSIIEGGYNYNSVLSFFGIGIIIASISTFGFGMCMNLMNETSDKSKGNNTSPYTDNVYDFLEKQRYYYK